MAAIGRRNRTTRTGRAGRQTIRAVVGGLAIAVVVGACSNAVATPGLTVGPSGIGPTQTAQILPTGIGETWPPAATVRDASGLFDVATGSTPRVVAAMDTVRTAGSELNDFGFDVFRRLDTSGNSCASPASIALALAMVRPGAKGETAAQMDTVMHAFGTPGQAALIAALQQLLNGQTYWQDPQTGMPGATPFTSGQAATQTLNVSDQVFSQKGMPLLPEFLNSLSSTFGAGVGLLDYKADPDGSRQVINKWVSQNTAGRIPQILDPPDITTSTRIALANAIYLKSPWTHPFQTSDTANKPFTTATGGSVSVPTMATELLLQYATGAGYRAVELPMGGDASSLSMLIVVPDNMASFVKGLTGSSLASIVTAEFQADVDLNLPRFSINSRVDLAETLQAMGMTDLFDDNRADLSGINGNVPEPLVVAKVIHQANIDVVEEGTTASAATVVIARAAAAAPPQSLPPKVTFHVDHPFIYLIREKTSGAVLFLGTVANPSTGS